MSEPFDQFCDRLLGAMKRGETVAPMSPEMLALAKRAAAQQNQPIEDVEAWATRLASDLAKGTD